MKLILDFGNTLQKIAAFESEEIDSLKIFEKTDFGNFIDMSSYGQSFIDPEYMKWIKGHI